MIISHNYKFIFIKTNKTAGTSIELALSKYCGPRDIITPITPIDERLRNSLGYPGPQNYLAPLSDYTLRDWAKLILKGVRKKRFYSHIPAQTIKQYIQQNIWDDYYKFCFERNPWDRIISLYYWRYKSEPRPTIAEFLDSGIPMFLRKRGYNLYTINDHVVVDRICRFENISKEIETVRMRLGIPDKLELPQAKSNTRKDKRSYREIINHNDRNKIEQLLDKEFDLLGYKF